MEPISVFDLMKAETERLHKELAALRQAEKEASIRLKKASTKLFISMAVFYLMIRFAAHLARYIKLRETRKCLKLEGEARKECLAKARQKGIKSQIRYLQKQKSKCRRARDPKKCEQVIDKQIRDALNKIN